MQRSSAVRRLVTPAGRGARRTTQRLLVAVLAAALVVAVAVPAVRPAVAAAAGLKVVIIVGPVESLTSTYRSYADRVAQTAASYGADVRKVYSPNATWSNVLNNIQGASIVVYMGHGNGYPNPYVSFLQPSVNDGFGLNDPNNPSDNVHVYYGESYIAKYVKLAPNAVVFLSHACYAAGSSESWDKVPSLSVAEQRVDNFAAGFVGAGARAVFALAVADPSTYLARILDRNLAGADTTMRALFETASDWDGGSVQRLASVRSSGFDEELDPAPSTSLVYIRSLVTWPGLTTGQVTGYDPGAPQLTAFSPQAAYLSPNGDGLNDAVTYTGTWSAPATWRLQVQAPDGTVVSETTGTGTSLSAGWAGTNAAAASATGGSVIVPDGLYRVVVDATDDAGHVSVPVDYGVTVDTVAPSNTAPGSYLYSGSTLGSSTTPVRTSWSGSDAGSGIASYALRRQVNGSAYYSVGLSSATATSVNQSLTFGYAYRYRLNATDRAANHDAWVYGRTFKPYRLEQTSSAVAYRGSWSTVSNSYASGGSFRYATAAGASASYTFSGSSVGWAAFKCPSCGSAKVYLDGVYRTTVSLYSSSYRYRPIVYAARWSANGSHTITIVVVGTAGHPRVYLDAFVRLYQL